MQAWKLVRGLTLVSMAMQRCSPRDSCLGSRPPRGSFSACLALALPQRHSASASAWPHDLGSSPASVLAFTLGLYPILTSYFVYNLGAVLAQSTSLIGSHIN